MPPPNNRRPFPDKAHEDLAQWVEETVANLDDSLLLVDTLFGLNDNARNDAGHSRGDINDSLLLVDVLFTLLDAATVQIADLSARLDALEPAVFTDKP